MASLREVLSQQWIDDIEESCDGNVPTAYDSRCMLDWDADTVCGLKIKAVCDLADYVASQWPDQRDELRGCALGQICVIAYG